MNTKEHWEKIYTTKSHKEVSWFSEHISSSLELIRQTKLTPSAKIIDVGGGASTLIDDLLKEGYADLTIIDISGAALDISKKRLKNLASKINWIEGDMLLSDFEGKSYDLWHDRAVFHFLTTENDRIAYRDTLNQHLNMHGYAIISVFADDGPEKCSGLTVKRHSAKEIADFFGDSYSVLFENKSTHVTPANMDQKFVNVILKKVRE